MYLKITDKASRAIRYTKSALRVKHFRGHGVHSPFVYTIIRKVFMRYTFASDGRSLYNELRAELCDKRSSRQLQNLYTHCEYSSFSIINDSNSYNPNIDSNIIIVSPSVDTQQIGVILDHSLQIGTPVVVMYPRSNKKRFKMCSDHIASDQYLTIDNRRFMLFYCDHKLPRQHFKL